MMKLYGFSLGGTVRWNISDDDPTTWPLAATGMQLLNPLVPVSRGTSPFICRLPDGRHHVVTNELYVLSPVELTDADRLIAPWLQFLKIAARQAAFSTEPYAGTNADIDVASLQIRTLVSSGKGMIPEEYRVQTALDGAAITRASELQSVGAAPLHHELLLDALHAFESRRDREAILYSAIAAESLAQHELTGIYENALGSDDPPTYLNIVNVDQAGGKKIKKDPIYELLTASDNFGRLLHEVPLYLLRRSLLDEDQALYSRAISLYRSRNRLSHGQAITSANDNLLQIDRAGSGRAVRTAVDIFAWFGQSGYYVPNSTSIQVEMER
jgi:hypothetical protein